MEINDLQELMFFTDEEEIRNPDISDSENEYIEEQNEDYLQLSESYNTLNTHVTVLYVLMFLNILCTIVIAVLCGIYCLKHRTKKELNKKSKKTEEESISLNVKKSEKAANKVNSSDTSDSSSKNQSFIDSDNGNKKGLVYSSDKKKEKSNSLKTEDSSNTFMENESARGFYSIPVSHTAPASIISVKAASVISTPKFKDDMEGVYEFYSEDNTVLLREDMLNVKTDRYNFESYYIHKIFDFVDSFNKEFFGKEMKLLNIKKPAIVKHQFGEYILVEKGIIEVTD